MTVDPRTRALLREVAAATEPPPEAIARVRQRLDDRLRPTSELLAALPEPTDAQARRVRARLRDRQRPTRRRLLVGGGLVAGGALVAAALLAWLGRGPPAEPVAVALADEAVQLSPHVRLSPEGHGEARGSGESWRVEWDQGALTAEVAPERGVDLEVSTPEASVRVVGTAFSVRRDRLGTHVAVARGAVALSCGDEPPTPLTASDHQTCPPTTAAGLLGRAHALSDGAAPADQVLATVHAALSRPDAVGAVRSELLAASLAPLLALERHAEALEAAEAYLSEGGARPEVRQVALQLALAVGDCERARIHAPDASLDERLAADGCAP